MSNTRGRLLMTCGANACFVRLMSEQGSRAAGWQNGNRAPKAASEIVADFRPHNINPNDGGVVRMATKPEWERWI